MALKPTLSSSPFRRSVRLLNADGDLQTLDILGQPFERSIIALCRERCIFGEFDPPPAAKGQTALLAARLHARSAQPFRRSDHLLTRKGPAFGIWWWDAEWVEERLEREGIKTGVLILPEPFLRASGEGARIVRTVAGYEAQFWSGDFLLADSWRRQPFSELDWYDFIRLQPSAEIDAGAPQVQAAPFVANSAYRRTLVSDATPDVLARYAIMVLAIALLASSAYFIGETVSLNERAAKTDAETTKLLQLGAGRYKAEAQLRVNQLEAIKRRVEGPDPLSLAQAAQTVVAPFGYKIKVFTADANHVRFELPEESAVGIDLIATELTASPYFSGITTKLNRSKKVVEVEMGVRRPR